MIVWLFKDNKVEKKEFTTWYEDVLVGRYIAYNGMESKLLRIYSCDTANTIDPNYIIKDNEQLFAIENYAQHDSATQRSGDSP